MTLTAVFSDVHASLEALYAVLLDCKQMGAERIVCLGDIIGGPNPKECMDLIMKYCNHAIKGNHDYYFMNGVPGHIRDDYTKKSDEWTRKDWFDPFEFKDLRSDLIGEARELIRKAKTLSEKLEWCVKYDPPKSRKEIEKNNHLFKLADQEKYFDFIEKELVTQSQSGELIFSHGFPSIMFKYADKIGIDENGVDADEEVYVVTQKQWQKKNEKRKRDKRRFAIAEKMVKYLPEGTTLFIGHSHIPCEIKYRKKNTRIINPGAVFQFRKFGDNIATYSLYNSESPIGHTTIRRIKYNRQLTESKIVGKGLMEDYFEMYQPRPF